MRNNKTNANDTLNPITIDCYIHEYGLTKREYFAAMALQGLCSSNVADSIKTFTEASVKLSDALIEALNK